MAGLTIAVAPDSRDAYFASLRAFARCFSFAILIAPTTPSGKDFIIQMFRGDVKVSGANSLRVEGFELGFFPVCPDDLDATTRNDINLVVADLTTWLSVREALLVWRRGRLRTVCARVAIPAA